MRRRPRLVRAIALSVAAAAALAAGAAPSEAQGFYYKELRRDGRIYVFNNAARAGTFETTGEMGAAITRPGAGPGGETVVADSERALQLFFFKHGIAEAVPEPKPPVQTVVWRDGKTRITTDNAYLEVSGRVQARFTGEFPDERTHLAGTRSAGDSRGSFRIRRAKLKLEGWMVKSWLSYELQVNFAAAGGSNVGAVLEDAAFDIDFSKGKGLLRLHAGQFKAPYGGQELAPVTALQFVDRALVSNTLFRGRETGVALWGATPDNRLEWRVGMSNGNGVTRAANDNGSYQYNARVMWQPNGSQPLNQRAWATGALYTESDFESSKTPIYAVAINWENQNYFNATAANDLKWNVVAVDGVYKFRGFALTGMYAWADRTPESGTSFGSAGGFLQAGQLFAGRRYEVAVRYGQYDPTDLRELDLTRETRAAFSWYYARHTLKWQSDIGRVEVQAGPGAPGVKTLELRTQLQFVF